MPAPSDKPLRATWINLYASDVEFLERTIGRGWTEVVRKLVEQHVKAKKEIQHGYP